MLHDGSRKANQEAHLAVVDIDVGPRDLQQCADAIIRLRAEYLYAQQAPDRIRFSFTSGDSAPFSRWAEGSASATVARAHSIESAIGWCHATP